MRSLLMAVLCGSFACASSTPELEERRVAFRYVDLKGRRQTLGALRGQAVLVHVMATWSDPALLEVPLLSEMSRVFQGRLEVLAMVVDQDPRPAGLFAQAFEVPYRVGRPEDIEAFLSEDGPFGPVSQLPTSFVLDASGRVRARNDGTWVPRQLKSVLLAVVPKS
ncbi:MAG: TlpA family protein disulfide reductase [Myxococcota bacterium]